jgi:hypothetical protein
MISLVEARNAGEELGRKLIVATNSFASVHVARGQRLERLHRLAWIIAHDLQAIINEAVREKEGK